MDEKRDLPLCLLQAFSLLIPGLSETFRKTELTPTDLFVLCTIAYLGKAHHGQQVLLGKQMRDMLQEFFRSSPSQITKRIERLENRGFVTWVRFTPDEKELVFGNRGGKKFVLVLSNHGSKKVEEFNDAVNALFVELTSGLRTPPTSLFSPTLQTMTEELVQHLSFRYDTTSLGRGLVALSEKSDPQK